MDSCVGKVVFCSISRKERILYSYNGGDPSVDSLARLCLSRAPPPFHRHYFHTAAGRTFAFLCQGDLTYFLIITTTTTTTTTDANSSSSKPRILNLLHQIHHGFGSGRDEMVATVKRLIESAEESMGRLDHQNQNAPSPTTATTKAPLLPDRRGAAVEEEVSLEVEEEADPVALLQLQQKKGLATGMWRRHAKIVVVADVAVCGVLFGVWMAVCRGFRCVS